MTRSELLAEIAIWTEDLWEAESNGWGNSAGECKAALERLYALLSTLSHPPPNPHNPHKINKIPKMENLIALTVRYIGPTNNRGSRIKMDLPRFGATRVISYNYEKRDAEDGAVAWLAENGIVPVARACGKDMSAILLISFQDIKTLETQFCF